MKILMTLALLISLSACKNHNQSQKSSSEYAMDCEALGHAVVRCENQEAVCYGSSAGFIEDDVFGDAGISCKFKK